MLTVSQVSKSFAGRVLFEDVSLQVNRGDRLGLVGPNGAGKSTLFSLLLGEASPDAGKVSPEKNITIRFLPQEPAAAGADWSKSFYQVLTEQAGKDAWPISGATFILVYKVPEKPVNVANALKFFDWAYANGDKMADELEYVPLPAAVKELVRKSWASNIRDVSGKAIAWK